MAVLRRAVRVLERVLSTLFWVLLLLGFNAPPLAMMTVLCAAMHEGGHLIALWSTGHHAGAPLHRPNGFLLPAEGSLSYKEELIVTAAGPLTNILVALLCLPLLPLGRDFFLSFACVSVLTGLCNLLPLGGYDGQRLLRVAVCLLRDSTAADILCLRLSFISSCILTFLSLYLIWRTDTGYWIFGVFFVSLLSHMTHELRRESSRKLQFLRKREKTRGNKRK